MENPLEVQKSVYGENGPPMIFTPEHSAFHLETPSPTTKRARTLNTMGEQQAVKLGEKEPVLVGELCSKVKSKRASLTPEPRSGDKDTNQQLSPCQLPGDFPPDLSFRALAAYSLIRTLSIQLRLSPFTPNAFLRAMYLPIPNRLLGNVHVALLRILFIQKLKSMGYSYKSGGGGVGVHKRRQVDNIRWPLLAGDNLTHLDIYSWPLFYDDYCHLTADRLWASYHSSVDDGDDNGHDKQSFIDFRNIGLFGAPPGEEYQTKRRADGVQVPVTDISKHKGEEFHAQNSTRSTGIKQESTVGESVRAESDCAELEETITMLQSDDSDSEDDYKIGDDDDDDDETWEKPRRKKKRRRTEKKKISTGTFSSTGTKPTMRAKNGTPEFGKQQTSPISNDWSRITSLGSPAMKSTPEPAPLLSKEENDLSVPSWSRMASLEPSFSSPQWSPRKQSVQVSQLQSNAKISTISSAETPVSTTMRQEEFVKEEKQDKIEQGVAAGTVTSEGDFDAFRIRGGGGANDFKFNGYSAPTGLNSQKIGRPRGSRRALPMRKANLAPRTSSDAIHAQHFSMSQLQQYNLQQQHQQYLYYQLQMQKQYGASQVSTAQYSTPNIQFQYQANQISVSNQIPRSGTKSRIKFEDHLQDLNSAFVVPNDIAETLGDFICGSLPQKRKADDSEIVVVDDEGDDNISTGVDDGFEKELAMKQWLHFKPLKAMRSGIPYHRLPTEEKVDILEFLIDELLTVEAISAEFTKRHNQTDYQTSPYGILPNDEDYKNLENNDECAVCGQEGDLLCCDGCVSSYHSGCLNMKSGQSLPEGKWLCPECSILDPCNFGSLLGGRKSSLDWFKVDDLVNPSDIQRHNDQSSIVPCTQSSLDPPSEYARSQDINTVQHSALVTHIEENSNTSHEDRPHHTVVAMNIRPTSDDIKEEWRVKEFIVIHGYVLCRNSFRPITTEARFDSSKATKPYLSLSKSELKDCLSQIEAQVGKRVSRVWPFSQTFTESSSRLNFNPCLYNNSYDHAPVSILTKTGAANIMTKLMHMTFESECNKYNASKLSEVLLGDMTLDLEISRCLKTQTRLFDPFELLKGYMLKLEQVLRRSCMLNEFWEGGKLKSTSEVWISKVRNAGSIRGLSRLLLKLVNAMQAQAFSATWVHNHLARTNDSETSPSERNYQPLPSGWSEEKEKLKRKWETTPSNMILNLCASEDKALLAFASGIRSDIFIAKQTNVIKSKRKSRKAAKSILSKSDEVTKSNIVEYAAMQEQTQDQDGVVNQCEEHLNESTAVVNDTIRTTGGNANIDEVSRESCHNNLNHSSDVVHVSHGATQDTKSNLLIHTDEIPGAMATPTPVGIDDVKNESMADIGLASKSPSRGNKEHKEATRNPSDINLDANESGVAIEVSVGSRINEENIRELLTPHEDHAETVKSNVNTETSPVPESSKKKRGRKPKFKANDPGLRRRTRRSGRLSTEHLVESRCTNDIEMKESVTFDDLEGMALQIENAKKRKIHGLEKLLKGQYAVQGIWPIAGRQIFPTLGNLPPNEMKRIARNAGSALAVNLSYQTNHEVAQVSYGHIWRKRVEQCNRYEELLHLMRILESSLDREMIHQCENQTKRGKTNLQKVIRITMRNPSTGSLEHFLMNKKSMKGCWVPAEHLDISSLILDLFCRRHRQKELRQKRVYQEKKRIDAEVAMKAEHEKRRREEARLVAKLKKKEHAATKKRIEQEAKSQARVSSMPNTQHSMSLGIQSGTRHVEIGELKKQIDLTCVSHELQVEYAVNSWNNKGYPNIPEKELLKIRQRTLSQLRKTRDRLYQYNELEMNDEDLVTKMYYSEDKVVAKLKSKKTVDRAVSNRSTSDSDRSNLQQLPSPSPGIAKNVIRSPGSIVAKDNVNGNTTTLYPVQNTVPGTPMETVATRHDHKTHQSSFGNNNSNQFDIKNSFLPSQPIRNQGQASITGNYFDKTHADLKSQSNNLDQSRLTNSIHSQQMQGAFQHGIQSQLSNSSSYSVPKQNDGGFTGAPLSGYSTLAYAQKSSASNAGASRSTAKMGASVSGYNNPANVQQRSTAKMGASVSGYNNPANAQQRSTAKQQNLSSFNHGQPLAKQPQLTSIQSNQLQTQLSSQQGGHTYGQVRQNFDHGQNSNSQHISAIRGMKSRQSMATDRLQVYSNQVHGQQKSSKYSHNIQTNTGGQHLQQYSSIATQAASLSSHSNNIQQSSYEQQPRNIWGQQNSMTTQTNMQQSTIEQQHQNMLGFIKHQNQQRELNYNQYSLDGINRTTTPNKTETSYGMSSMNGNLGNPSSFQTNSVSQSHRISDQAANTGYQLTPTHQPGNQQGGGFFLRQNTGQGDNSFPYTLKQTNQVNYNTLSRNQSMSAAPQMTPQQHQHLHQTAYQGPQQQQYSQSQQQNQAQHGRGLQNQNMFMMFQQAQNNQNDQQRQYPPGSRGNNYFR